MEKGKRVVPGSPFQKWKNGEVTVGIRCHIHVAVVTEEIAFPVGIPSPVTVRLRVMAFPVTGRTAVLLTFADPFFPLLSGSADRCAVTGKGQMFRINQSLLNGPVQELLVIKSKDEQKESIRL